METTNTAWTCQIVLTGSQPTESARQALSMRWMEIVLDSGGTLSPRPFGASAASWRRPVDHVSPLAAVWAMQEAAASENARLRDEGKPELKLTLLLHGSELRDEVEGSIHARHQHLRAPGVWLTSQAVAAAVGGFIFVKGAFYTQVLGRKRQPAARVEVTPPPLPAMAVQRPALPPIEIHSEVSWAPATDSTQASREFTLVTNERAA